MKNNLLNKVAFFILVFIYDIVSLFWCYILVKSLIFELSTVAIGMNGIEVIGGADIPTLIYKMGNVIGVVFPILFVLLSITTVVLFTLSIFKKQTNRKFNILLCIFLVLSLIVFMMIPAQTYAISLYLLARKLSFIRYIGVFYIVLSIAIIVINILFSIGKKNASLK